MFNLTVVNKILRHCHSWLAGQYMYSLLSNHYILFFQGSPIFFIWGTNLGSLTHIDSSIKNTIVQVFVVREINACQE